ncbi:protein RALF-like protein 34 [Cinnamomum micranthum f. kanehirae]|uniref:Protein RALF-like protein 34 n=1 Tax=Cinnamomum micranthum f. kanehirae TaxID=337451 RepID=A0A3S3PAN2_9MAGN|nr:protein RALF-like protein 34 [Cinnamomum micranthum f. kanehirae]
MSSSSTSSFLFKLLSFLLSISCFVHSHVVDETGFQLMGGSLEWPSSSIYDLINNDAMEEHEQEDEERGTMMMTMGSTERRSLYQHRRHRRHYYISYAALSANRIPCPPRSGRSYYTHNCYKALGPAHPYVRGCSAITRCRA